MSKVSRVKVQCTAHPPRNIAGYQPLAIRLLPARWDSNPQQIANQVSPAFVRRCATSEPQCSAAMLALNLACNSRWPMRAISLAASFESSVLNCAKAVLRCDCDRQCFSR